jgi:hypothetical protein
MNALHGLLPPPAVPPRLPVPAPATIIDAARARRRARARRSAGTAAGMLTLTVAAAVVLHPASGAERLRPAHQPTPSTRPTPATTPETTVARDDVTPVTHVSPTTAHPASPTVSSTTPPVVRRAESVITRAFVDDSRRDCEKQYAAPDVVLCDRADGPATLKAGEPARFVFEVCAGAGREQTVPYPGSAEAKAEIVTDPDRDQFWQASPERGGPGAHDVVIPAGRCLRYTVRWDGKDTAGHPLPPGRYVFSALVAADLTWADSSEVTFTVS